MKKLNHSRVFGFILIASFVLVKCKVGGNSEHWGVSEDSIMTIIMESERLKESINVPDIIDEKYVKLRDELTKKEPSL